MPIYEYKCSKCSHCLEALQKISDAPLRKCPACGKAGLKKLVSAASFRLKGGGWYETDFKTGDKKQLADQDSGKGASGDNEVKAEKAAVAAKPAESKNGETGKSAQKPEATKDSKSENAKPASARKKSPRQN